MDLQDLSEKQKNILTYLWEYMQKMKRPPTIREIGHAVHITSTSVVNYNLKHLAEKGLIDRDAEVSRGLTLTEKARRFFEVGVSVVERKVVRIPLAGNIVAGQPIEVGHDNFATYDQEDVIEVSANMLPDAKGELFALRVSGDSMIDAMINDGDIVILKPQETARNGEMVAVWLLSTGTTTLKHFYHEGEQIRLQPANPTMLPIYADPADVRVQGKVVMVMRQTA